MEYSLNGNETENLRPVARSIFTLVKPQLDANWKRYENGKKGGAPVSNSNSKNNQKTTKKQPNVNVNVNDNTLVESNESTDELSFEKAWELYERKGNKKTSMKKWANLKNHCREAALKHIPLYVQSTPDKQFRKNFETYINQEVWNDEILTNQQHEQPKQSESRLHPALR
jgi:hypothetical protein